MTLGTEALSRDEVCKALDSVLVRQLELIQEYIDLCIKQEAYQKDGYLNLAKSRYIQGPNSLSSIQLPTEDSEEYKAVVTVSSSGDLDSLCSSFDDSVVLIHKNDDKPFKREVKEDSGEGKGAKLLRQFGVLAPGTVKTAQKSFRESIELSLNRINVGVELNLLQRQYKALLDAKRLMNLNGENVQPPKDS